MNLEEGRRADAVRAGERDEARRALEAQRRDLPHQLLGHVVPGVIKIGEGLAFGERGVRPAVVVELQLAQRERHRPNGVVDLAVEVVARQARHLKIESLGIHDRLLHDEASATRPGS